MPMADPVYPNRDVGATNPERELPEHATPSQIGHVPVMPVNPRLNSAAESVGSALGTAVSNVRNLPNTLQDAKARFTVIRGRRKQDIQQTAEETVNRIREAGAEIKEQAREQLGEAKERLADVKDQALRRADEARARADRLAHEYPLHVIAGAAAVGMLLGIGLRIWRDYAS